MAINPQDRIHGACISEIVLELSKAMPTVRVRVDTGIDRSSYLFDCIDTESGRSCIFGVYLKYSRKRLSPWSYSYEHEHQVALQNMATNAGEVFSIFVNGEDGYACIDFKDLREILDEQFEEVEWVRVQRKLRESYRLSGTDGSRIKPLAQNAFPQLIIAYVTSSLNKAIANSAVDYKHPMRPDTRITPPTKPSSPAEAGIDKPKGIKAFLSFLR